jgi:probable O-glycosylation ligase (exosortase A-associated)
MRDLAFAAFFVAYLPLILRYPHIGAMIWAWLSFASPDDYLYGFMTTLPLSKIVAVLTLGSLLLTRDGRRPYLDPMMAAMLAFVVAGLISASLAITPLPVNWELFGKIAKIVVLCFVLLSVLTTRLRLQGLIMAIALGLAFNGVDEGLKVLLSGGGHHVIGVATMGDNNSFAVAMLMCMPLLLYLHQTSANRLTRLCLAGGLVLCCVSVIGSYSRGGFLGLITFAFGLIALNRNKLRNLAIVALGGAVLLWLAPASWFARIDSISSAGQDGSFMERVTAWKVSTMLALDRPLIGGGFHAIQDTRVWTHYGPTIGALSFVPSGFLRPTGMAAHSIYFEVLGDLGFTGLLLFVAMLALALRACGQIRRRAAPYPDLAWMRELAGMIRLSLIVYMVAGAALSFAYFEAVYLLVAVLSVTRHMLAAELAQRGPANRHDELAGGELAWNDLSLAPWPGERVPEPLKDDL